MYTDFQTYLTTVLEYSDHTYRAGNNTTTHDVLGPGIAVHFLVAGAQLGTNIRPYRHKVPRWGIFCQPIITCESHPDVQHLRIAWWCCSGREQCQGAPGSGTQDAEQSINSLRVAARAW
jgi:hypothetical protein